MKKIKILVTGWDGYIGFPLCLRLLDEGYSVVGVDNYIKREQVKEMESFSALPILSPEHRKRELQKIGDFQTYDINVCGDFFYNTLNDIKPNIIVNLAHMNSAPYSMIDRKHSEFTLMNNIVGTNNFLWYLKGNKDVEYITISSTGTYDHYCNVDIEEGYFKFIHNGRKSKEMIFPRRPGSIYHTSKTGATYLIDYLTRTWELYCTDIMQSVVFGAWTPEIEKYGLYSAFHSDECFGTVLNRFIIQSVLGVPMTVYGEGKHQRAFLSLVDSIQALMIAIETPYKEELNYRSPDKPRVWNQLSEWRSMNDLAFMVEQKASEKGLTPSITHIPTPRNEITENHYYNYVTEELSERGYIPSRTIEEEIEYCIDKLIKRKNDIEKLKDVVLPKINFRG